MIKKPSTPSPRRRTRMAALSPFKALMSVGSAVLIVAASQAAVTPAASSAQNAAAPTHFTVLVGKDIAAGGRSRPADLMSFFPGTIAVHRGDTLTFRGEFHTATALPEGTDPAAWVRANARRLGQRYFFLSRDDEKGALQFNPRVLYPNCNVTAGCSYDGRRLVNSGGLGLVAPKKVTLTVNAPAGHSFWVICLIHPQMRLHVKVVSGGTAVRSQAQINQAVQKQVNGQTATATGLWNRLQRQQSHTTSTGRRVFDAYAGFDTKGIEMFGMFPRVIQVKRGSTVMWHFGDLRYEPHSVVFPASTAQKIATGPPPMCESNSGSRDVPATKQFTCPSGSHGPVEIELDPRVVMPSGSGTVTSQSGYHDSGARGGFDIANSEPYTLRFPVASPAKGFRYACGVHGTMMTGFVKVR